MISETMGKKALEMFAEAEASSGQENMWLNGPGKLCDWGCSLLPAEL